MTTELLYQLFLVVLIIIGIILIVVLWKVMDILRDVKKTTTIVSKRSIQIDNYLEKAVDSARGVREMLKGFLFSFDFLKYFKQKFDKK